MDKETADKLRGLVRRVTLKNVKDDGETQRASIEVADGIHRDDVEVLQPFGFASSSPEDGALAIVLAVGGDEGDQVLLPIGNPSKRMGGLQPGDAVLYSSGGDKLVLSAGGGGKLETGGDFVIRVANLTIIAATVTVQADVTIDGTLHVTGNISSDSPDGDDE